MKDKKQDGSNKPESEDTSAHRRKVIKGLMLGGTVVTATQWSKPMVEAVVLPAHAAPISITAVGAGSNTFPGSVNP